MKETERKEGRMLRTSHYDIRGRYSSVFVASGNYLSISIKMDVCVSVSIKMYVCVSIYMRFQPNLVHIRLG
jgi:hypothetical protein